MLPKKLALIHSFSGFGHSTMSVILPIVSAMGIQGCPLPTAVFSNHTGFTDWYKVDFTEHLSPFIDAWERLQLRFDGIYSGYLGSGAQCESLLSFVQKHPEATFFLDPVMGDHGRLYRAITDEHVAAMKALAAQAHYIFPNITEACVLTDTTYKEAFTQEEILALMHKLHAMGPAHIVITGLLQDGIFTNYTFEQQNGKEAFHAFSCPSAGTSRPGTGDIFGAVTISGILKGQPLEHCVPKAARFVSDCIQVSDANNLPVCEGTCFELVLPTLLSLE